MEVNGFQYCFGCIDFHYMDKHVSIPGTTSYALNNIHFPDPHRNLLKRNFYFFYFPCIQMSEVCNGQSHSSEYEHKLIIN